MLEVEGKKPIVISDFVVRNKGKGYNARFRSFEMKLFDDMKRRLYYSK